MNKKIEWQKAQKTINKMHVYSWHGMHSFAHILTENTLLSMQCSVVCASQKKTPDVLYRPFLIDLLSLFLYFLTVDDGVGTLSSYSALQCS